jgi:hypothetical protein
VKEALMQVAPGKLALVIALLGALAACSEKEPNLMSDSSGNGPDEFSILPPKPLQDPGSYSDLPAPTPGAGNRSDPTPRQDAVNALGGRGDRVVASGLQAGEQPLVNHAGRYGVSGTIRADLARDDLEWRRKHDGKLLERLLNVNVYYRAYEKMSLDKYEELKRLRRLGIWTPAVPPQQSN